MAGAIVTTGAAEPSESGDRSGAEGGRETVGVPASILITTIAVLVVLVSMPQFRAHVIDANRSDARSALRVLGPYVFEHRWNPKLDASGHSPFLMHVVEATKPLAHRFPDARRIPDTKGFLHHGYRIDTGWIVDGLVRTPALVAWPDDHGKTGDAAFAITADGSQYGHMNGGLWSGGERPLVRVDLSDESWVLRRVDSTR